MLLALILVLVKFIPMVEYICDCGRQVEAEVDEVLTERKLYLVVLVTCPYCGNQSTCKVFIGDVPNRRSDDAPET